MADPSDFAPDTPTPPKKSSVPMILMIIGGVGCGCFGLVILLGIIAAIALPSFLNQANKAREFEAKELLRSMVRAQEAHFQEKNTFVTTIQDLGLGLSTETVNYSYQIEAQGNEVIKITASSKDTMLSSYTAGIFVLGSGADALIITGICESDAPTMTPPEIPTLKVEAQPPTVECATGSSEL